MGAEGWASDEVRGDDLYFGGSPWTIVGPSDSVVMVSENSYVGDHTPQVKAIGSLPCGIAQAGLALQRGKQYEGCIVLAGSGSVNVSLVWGDGTDQRQTITIKNLADDYAKTPLQFTAGADTDDGRLEITGRGAGTFRIGVVSLMPADNIEGMRADTLKLLKELNAPIYRWPGGNFVSGYDWRDGLGDPDKRPPRINLAWPMYVGGLEMNDFGFDEFMTLCELLGAEAYLAVNCGFGDDHSAANEVEYANGSADTPMGKWRAANGHPEPYNIKWWGIGNEMYGSWQLGYMHLNHYVIKHNIFAKAMRQVDPSIKLIGVGSAGDWSKGMLTNCADNMDLISEHFYCGEKESLVEHTRQFAEIVRSRVGAYRDYHKDLEALKGKDIRIAFDEWNYWYGDLLEWGRRKYRLKDALGIAMGLHEMFRHSDMVFMANYALTVNALGGINTNKTDASFQTTALALKLYRNKFGKIPIKVAGELGDLDIAAAWTKDRKSLTIAAVNPTYRECRLDLDIKGAQLKGKGHLSLITGSDARAYNPISGPPQVVIEEKSVKNITDTLTLPGLSISLYELPTR
ncbi:MAG: alpha-L-arabinofuranosidase C-terminal domain-containing protein [bacterium]